MFGRRFPLFFLSWLCIAAVWAQAPAAGEKRVALVIGNAAYASSPLRNPTNDSTAIAAKLRRLGFEVIARENLRTRQIGTTLRDFRNRLQPGTVALFFYAGHGIQLKGINYLPTVDADIRNEDDVPLNSVSVNQILDIMDDAKTRLNLVFLDACRNNPFTRRFRSAGGGLARIDAPSGTLISFATRPGSIAADGEGRHGLYTEHLLAQLEVPNQQIEQALKRVVAGVKKASNNQQEPWMEGSLDGDFYFAGGTAAGTAGPAMAVASAGYELTFWDSVKDSERAEDFRAYLDKYPAGQFAPLAQNRLRRLAPAGSGAETAMTRDAGAAVAAGGKPFRDCPECPEMVVIPAGSFQMGASAREAGSGDSERPVHAVRIAQPLAVGHHEVTRREFAAFANATGYKVEESCYVWYGAEWQNQRGRSWRDPGFDQDDNHPVVCVSWQDAKAYVAWLAMKTGKPYRLLSESEWEYAARGGTRTSRFWGDDPALACEFANVHDSTTQSSYRFPWDPHDCRDNHVETAPVGRFKANPYGLHDMLGNVWEWVEDCQTVNYIGAPADGGASVSEACARRVYRGGGWSGPASVRAATRNGNPANYRSQLLGIRVVRPVQ